MREWISNGAALGWMIDADSRTVEIYRPGQQTETRTDIDSIAGEGPVEGFNLGLAAVWNPLGR
jgi:Uma2 family endonuclease